MGSGDIGTNGSVHWKVSHSDRPGDPGSTGIDPIPVAQIGRGSDGQGGGPSGKNHPGFLRVRLRFTGDAGMTSLQNLLRDLQSNKPTPDYVLDILVPAIPRTPDEIARGSKDPWEVRVDW